MANKRKNSNSVDLTPFDIGSGRLWILIIGAFLSIFFFVYLFVFRENELYSLVAATIGVAIVLLFVPKKTMKQILNQIMHWM